MYMVMYMVMYSITTYMYVVRSDCGENRRWSHTHRPYVPTWIQILRTIATCTIGRHFNLPKLPKLPKLMQRIRERTGTVTGKGRLQDVQPGGQFAWGHNLRCINSYSVVMCLILCRCLIGVYWVFTAQVGVFNGCLIGCLMGAA